MTTTLAMRPYQDAALDGLRAGLRAGMQRQILCAPTGSGKTEMALYLIEEARRKGSRVAFICDRRVLVAQTSQRMADYHIPHGIVMHGATRGAASEQVLVCSAQTLEKRAFPEVDLVIIDEAHTQRKAIQAAALEVPVIGLTATPLTPGLGEFYEGIVNSTTTNALLSEGWLAPLRVYQSVEIDMRGASTTAGEWNATEVRRRGAPIIGDIVGEWARMTRMHFGGPVKTLVFSADVEHGAELCAAFQRHGYDFRQSTYRDDLRDTAELVAGFRRGAFTGLVSVEKFVKGFDVPDVLCLVGARPYRTSLASVIQQLGRGMRIAPAKDYALYLDHAGNMAGWWGDVQDVWANGVTELPSTEQKAQVRREGKDRPDVVCPQCGLTGGSPCAGCGYERPRRTRREVAPGRMEELEPEEWRENDHWMWRQLCRLALEKSRYDVESARRKARGYYRGLTGHWPRWSRPMDPTDEAIDPQVARAVKNSIRRWRRG